MAFNRRCQLRSLPTSKSHVSPRLKDSSWGSKSKAKYKTLPCGTSAASASTGAADVTSAKSAKKGRTRSTKDLGAFIVSVLIPAKPLAVNGTASKTKSYALEAFRRMPFLHFNCRLFFAHSPSVPIVREASCCPPIHVQMYRNNLLLRALPAYDHDRSGFIVLQNVEGYDRNKPTFCGTNRTKD